MGFGTILQGIAGKKPPKGKAKGEVGRGGMSFSCGNLNLAYSVGNVEWGTAIWALGSLALL